MKSENLIHLFTERNGQRELVQIDMENIEGWGVIDHGSEEGHGIIELQFFDGQTETVLIDPNAWRSIFDHYLLRGWA
jgi:hypothetical protein